MLYKWYSGFEIEPWTNKYFTTYQKKGGILKADGGTSFNNIYAGGDNPDIGYNTYLNQFFLDPATIAQMDTLFGGDLTKYSDFVKNNVNTRYSAGINNYQNNKTYIGSDTVRSFNTGYQNSGNTFNYLFFGNSDEDYNNRQNGIAYKYAQFSRPTNPMGTGDRYNSDKALSYIDDALGLQTYSRVASLTDANLSNFGVWGDYWKGKGATGAYYFKAAGDKSGFGQWIPTNDTSIEGYKAFDPDPVLEPKTKTEPEIKPETKTETEPDTNLGDKKSTRVYPYSLGDNKENKFVSRFGNYLLDAAPDLIGAGRLFRSIRTNNKVASTLSDATKPTLLNTYELYSPITGAFSEMQFRNRQAADLRRQASRPFTSDASLQLASQLDANRQARELEYQGFLADDKEIKRTKEEALKRQEDNITRRTDIANKNRASINDAILQKAKIEATRLKSNWTSADNFMKEIQSRLRTSIDEARTRRQNANIQYASDMYQNKVSRYNAEYKELYPNATYTSMLDDTKYIDDMEKIKRRYRYELYNIINGRYLKNPYKNNEEILSYDDIRVSKKGGILKPNVINLINKVIKDESYT